MRNLLDFYNTSAGKKVLMGLSGAFLLSFLCVHLYINLFLLKSDQGAAFDVYAEFMATYPLVRPVEIGLFLGFLLHALTGIVLWLVNRRVRPVGYAVDHTAAGTTWASRFTIVTGFGILTFLAVHIRMFFIESRFLAEGRTMHDIVAASFSNPWITAFYVAAVLFLGFHLRHGFQSLFQTFGLRHLKYRGLIDVAALFFWLIIPLCFAAIPLYFILGGVPCR